jgi:hypothetical protein
MTGLLYRYIDEITKNRARFWEIVARQVREAVSACAEHLNPKLLGIFDYRHRVLRRYNRGRNGQGK